MIKSMKFLAALLVSASIFCPLNSVALEGNAALTKAKNSAKATEETTRADAVIFKVHEIEPVAENGVVKGCNFMVTLYNRTTINFRTFTINLNWKDEVDERFKFDRYVENILGVDEAAKQKTLFSSDEPASKPMQTSITVNAFGADKQISLRSYIENEKCYLMLTEAEFSVTPCEIARNMGNIGKMDVSADKQDCTPLFQYVSTDNPEYFKEFKNISLTAENAIRDTEQASELSDIDIVIEKIVNNMGTSDETLTKIY